LKLPFFLRFRQFDRGASDELVRLGQSSDATAAILIAISAADRFDRFGVWIIGVVAVRRSSAFRNSSPFNRRLTGQYCQR
jgi:hypothetical protein